MLLTADNLAVELKAKLFRGFADSSRLAILEALREKPLNVTELARSDRLKPVEHLQPLELPARLWSGGQ